jgi:phosphoribosylanthranilate isomerase
MADIRPASDEADLACVKGLFRDYAAEFAALPSFRGALCLQGFEAELAELPGAYTPPTGALLLAVKGNEAVGCVALKRLSAGVCELKRLYVRREFRGRGLGRQLVEAISAAARRSGYAKMRLDSLAEMAAAVALYRSCGFEDVPAYNDNPSPHAVFLEKDLLAAEPAAAPSRTMRLMGSSRLLSDNPRACPWTKLCGVRDAVTAAALAELRPDAIGLNFYAGSARCVSARDVVQIARTLPPEVATVGVFVNATADEILERVESVGLVAAQLHGDEPAALIAELKRRRAELVVIKAWRMGEEGLAPLAHYLADCQAKTARPDAVLIDAKVTGTYGGTGKTAPWELLRGYDPAWPPLILAGGLTPENVGAAVATVRPWGVDTAGGIERSPGVKDPALAAAFLEAVRRSTSSAG